MRTQRSQSNSKNAFAAVIRTNSSAPPVDIPAGHVGPVFLPGSGRLVWWTGRVAIGLRHEPVARRPEVSHSALWLQDLMLSKRSMAVGH